MALSAFDDKTRQPQDDDLKEVLGRSAAHWSRLIARITERFSPCVTEWGYTSRSTGWGLRLKQKERVILYMTPCHDYFLASFVLGERGVAAAHEADLPASIVDMIDGARKYAEGRGVRLEVRTAQDVRTVEKLADIKMIG